MHIKSEPSILYFGTPVVLISTLNEDGTSNLAPMSSAFWLGWCYIFGLFAKSKTTQNMIRTGECVLSLPFVEELAAVNCLARTTGSNPVPESKIHKGYRHESDKFGIAEDDLGQRGNLVCIEVRIQRVHIEESILMNGEPNRINPNKWRPLIMSFQEFYGLGPQLQVSTLGQIPESLYRSPDVDRAHNMKE